MYTDKDDGSLTIEGDIGNEPPSFEQFHGTKTSPVGQDGKAGGFSAN